ncbi:MAG: ribosomal protein S18-alanine N-acetyltransferase [Clostridia bacterium]|nr:ribosomal protein S18-alanine N-acetyltransferase [Clostridia bacterium]
MQITLREIQSSDSALLAETERVCFSASWSKSAIDSVCARADFCGVLAFIGEQAVGYLLGTSLFETAEVLRIAVLPAFRGNHYGGAILDSFLGLAQRKGAERVFLEVREDNAPAIKLYQSRGFLAGRTRKNYYEDGATAVEMYKDL